MKVLIITNLFPNQQEHDRGIFNKQQFCSLKKFCDLKVIAPLPWIPNIPLSAKNQNLKDIPYKEVIEGIETFHPHYFVTPKFGRGLYGFSFYLGINNTVKKIQKDFDFDLIFATWMYPDAYGAALISKNLNKPLVTRAHGTDINVTSRYFFRRKMIQYACNVSRNIVTNSRDLKNRIEKIGVDSKKVQVIINGVDKQKFYPLDQLQAQAQCGLSANKKHVVFIGNLVAIKGVNYLIEAVNRLNNDVVLHILGDGVLKESLLKQVNALNLRNRIVFEGRKSHDEIVNWLNAADVLCLPSLNEGCPNVVLEALACQTPVVASNVGAVPDLIDNETKGILVQPKDVDGLVKGLEKVLQRNKEVVNFKVSSWDDNARELFGVFEKSI